MNPALPDSSVLTHSTTEGKKGSGRQIGQWVGQLGGQARSEPPSQVAFSATLPLPEFIRAHTSTFRKGASVRITMVQKPPAGRNPNPSDRPRQPPCKAGEAAPPPAPPQGDGHIFIKHNASVKSSGICSCLFTNY